MSALAVDLQTVSTEDLLTAVFQRIPAWVLARALAQPPQPGNPSLVHLAEIIQAVSTGDRYYEPDGSGWGWHRDSGQLLHLPAPSRAP